MLKERGEVSGDGFDKNICFFPWSSVLLYKFLWFDLLLSVFLFLNVKIEGVELEYSSKWGNTLLSKLLTD